MMHVFHFVSVKGCMSVKGKKEKGRRKGERKGKTHERYGMQRDEKEK